MRSIYSAALIFCAVGIVILMPRDHLPVQDLPIAPWADGKTPRHVVAFGTSLTAGNGWPDRLGDALATCFGHPVVVDRVALPNAGSDWGLGAVPRVVALSPDVVVVEFAINDADLRDGVSLAQSRLQHIALFDVLAHELPDARIVAMTMSPAFGPRGWIRLRLGRYYAQVVEVAHIKRIALFDFYPRWRAIDTRSLLPDGLHPTNAATQRIMGKVMLQSVSRAAGLDCD